MNGCQRYRDRLPSLALGLLEEPGTRELLEHLASGCQACSMHLSRMQAVADGLASMIPPRAAASDVGLRVKQCVRALPLPGAVADGFDRPACAWRGKAALFALGALTRREEYDFRRHLAEGCEACVREYERAADLVSEMVAPRPLQPSAAVTERIKRAVRSAAPDGRGTQAPLVGREAEVKALSARLASVRRGQGAFVSIEGEAGVGKSRLVQNVLALTPPGVEVWSGHASAIEGTAPYGPFADMLERWAGMSERQDLQSRRRALRRAIAELVGGEDWPQRPFIERVGLMVADAEDERGSRRWESGALERRVRESVRDLILRRLMRGPLVLLLEDLHWADASSMALLEFLLPLVEEHALLIIGVTRTPAGERVEELLRAAAGKIRLHCHRLPLAVLDERASLRLVRSLCESGELSAGLARLVRDRTGGNPLFIEEVVRAESLHDSVAHQVPAAAIADYRNVEAVIRFHLERLDEDSRAVLECASVTGRRFQRAVLARVVDGTVDLDGRLERLTSAGLIEPSRSHATATVKVATLRAEASFSFRHALLQSVVRDAIPIERRRRLHLRCARAIEDVFADRIHDFYGVLSYQYSAGGDLAAAHGYLMRAGEIAAASAASAEALSFFRQAYETYHAVHSGQDDAAAEARLERNLALALLNTGHLSESIEHFNAALRLLGEKVPSTRISMTMKGLCDALAILGRLYTGSLGNQRRPASARERALFELMYNRCRAQNIADDGRRVFDNLAAIRHVGHLDPATVENSAGILAAAGAFFAFSGLFLAPSHRFLALARRLANAGDDRDGFLYQSMAFVVSYLEGDWSERRRIDEDLLQRGLRLGLLWDADVYLGLLCERFIYQGQYRSARECIARLASLQSDWGYRFARSNELAAEAYLALEQRRLGEARDAAARWKELREEPSLRLLAVGLQLRVEVLEGKLGEAEGYLREAERATRAAWMLPYYAGVYRTARLALGVARCEHAVAESGGLPAPLLRQVSRDARLALACASKVARDRCETMRLCGRFAWIRGREDVALAWWKRSLAEAERLGMPAQQARVYADLATALDRAGGPRAETSTQLTSAECRDRARRTFERLGCEWDLEQLERGIGRKIRVA